MLLINSHECSRVPTSRLPLSAAMWRAVAPSSSISWIMSAWASQNNEPRQLATFDKNSRGSDYARRLNHSIRICLTHLNGQFDRDCSEPTSQYIYSRNRRFHVETIHNFLADLVISFQHGDCATNKMPLFDVVAMVHSKNLRPLYCDSSPSF